MRRGQHVSLPFLACAAVLLAAAAAGCHETPASDPDAGDASVLDARPQDSRVPDAATDAGPDASPDGQVIQHDFCNEPFFKLPIDGQIDNAYSVDINGRKVLWTKIANYPQTVRPGEVYVLDLDTCVERQLTVGTTAGNVHIRDNHVVWDDFSNSGGPFCTDLYHLDLGTGIRERLTQSPGCEQEPRTNGRYVVYRWVDTIQGPPTVAPTLRLLDMETSDDIELWRGSVDSFDLDDRYVVWPGYGSDPQSVGRDLWVHDLETGETRHLDFTYERYQWWIYIWQGWVTIRGTDDGLWDPLSYLQLYHLETQELRSLVEGDYSVASAHIDSGLTVWNTSLYSQAPQLLPADMDLYEISTGQSRRLTTQVGQTAPVGLAPPYLLMIRFLNLSIPSMNDYYVANLEALGVLDASGLLVPGGPVIDPP